ncbi:MAG TPA: hypothetical protein IAD02_04285 [Candidatus Enterousia intestinigallinarum]|uniref:Uncharacterized protein n=1 Tax=Candidatus Enterousia intestinigallinarum TaxID=2840790 RepID=A0A9D1JXQ3_9PROT|nr:hypothetical protein [Candidatus Enterousia intestinigallinarum]
MKNDLKISTLTIICVLCTAVSGAYGASSVRSFGGSGTYASASDAAAANTSSATSVSSVRGGSVRVNPGSGVSGSSTTIEAGTTTNGRVATTPRLSIGHYLGGGTSISGGSSLRPQTPGSSGGSSSGGDGGLDPDVAAGLRQQVDQLQRDVEDLRNADDNINDQLLDKQDALIPGDDGYIIIDDATNEIFVDVDALQGALETVAGKDGREVELGSNDTHLLWRYVGDNDWYELIAKADITGPQGEKGEKGDPGEAANLDAYSTTEQMNQAIGNAIAALADVYATKAELANYATTDDLSLGLAAKANAADVYTKAEVYNKTEVDDKVADIVAGDVDEALANKADKTYVDSQLANKADKTELAGYATVESVSALDSEMDEVNATATDAALGAAQALSGLTGKEDTSNKTQTLTNSATQYPSGAAVTSALAGKADKTELENYVTSDELAGKADQSALDSLTGRVSANEAGISELNTTMGSGELTTTDKTVLGAINELKTKTDGMATDGNFEEMNNKITEMEGKLDGKQDVANMAQTVTDDETKYPSSAAVYGELETKANASDLANYATTETVNQIEQNVTNVTQTVTQLGDTINNAETGLAAKVDDAVAAATEAKEAADAATSAVAGKQDALGFTPENVANKSSTVVDDETKYPSSAAVYGELETKANVSDLANYATTETVNQIEQNVTNVTQKVDEITNPDTGLASQVTNITNVIGDEDSGLVKDVADVAAAADAAQQTATDAKNTADAAQTTADEAKAGLDAKEDKSNKAASITAENQSSATAYPTVGAVTQWTNDRINELSTEGLPVNPDNIGAGAITTEKIADNAVTEDKLSDELNAEIDAKANADDLGALATKDQIANADVADDAAIAKSKLALDVQTALDKAENAVSTDGAAENSVLGTDGEGNPVWYEIAM